MSSVLGVLSAASGLLIETPTISRLPRSSPADRSTPGEYWYTAPTLIGLRCLIGLANGSAR